MAFNGYLIKVGDFIIPLEMMEVKSYSGKVNTLDEEAYNDANGVLQRSVIQRIPKVSFKFLEPTQADVDYVMQNCRNNYSVMDERKATLSVWVPEYGDYVTQEMYMSDPEFIIQSIDNGIITYETTQITFTGYGE